MVFWKRHSEWSQGNKETTRAVKAYSSVTFRRHGPNGNSKLYTRHILPDTFINILRYFLISSIQSASCFITRSLSVSQKSFHSIYGVPFLPPWFLNPLSPSCYSHGTPILPASANSWLCLVFCTIPNLSMVILAYLSSAARAW